MSEEIKNDKLKNFVEERILRYTFHAKNFSKEDMDRVDEYCKANFGNDRKKMILTLITMMEDNVNIKLLNDKINFVVDLCNQEFEKIYGVLLDKDEKKQDKINNINEEIEKKVSWKGFGKNDNK